MTVTSVGSNPARLTDLRTEKLRPWHRERLAVVYVRQSTVQQVFEHHESTRLQYGLASKAQELGWSAERVLVIDEDLGKSGASAVGRTGFQRLVTEVSLDHVGIILGVDMSRLARSNTDWHQLLELVWRRPNRMTLQNMLKHPLYAGAYVYGRRQDDPRRKQLDRPRSGRVVMPSGEWLVFLPNHCPAYIAMEQYERNQAQLHANRSQVEAPGAVRGGAALLAGLVVCAQCGTRLGVKYDNGKARRHTYECVLRHNCYREPRCQHVAGPCLDTFVSDQVLAALEPAAVELSLTAAEHLEQERTAMDTMWQHRRERAAYEAERTARQYHAVEPEHRLVARTLEQAWEEQLTVQRRIEEEYHRFQQQQPRVLSEAECAAIRRLATDIPALWLAPTTTVLERKEIIRQVVDRVVVNVQGKSELVQVRIEWIGGETTEGTVIRPVAHLRDVSTYPQLCDLVQSLTQTGWTAAAIAQAATEAGYHAPRANESVSAQTIRVLQQRLQVNPIRPRLRQSASLLPDEWWPTDLARLLEMPRSSLHRWVKRGFVQARQLDDPVQRWVIWADEVERARLCEHYHRIREETIPQRESYTSNTTAQSC